METLGVDLIFVSPDEKSFGYLQQRFAESQNTKHLFPEKEFNVNVGYCRGLSSTATLGAAVTQRNNTADAKERILVVIFNTHGDKDGNFLEEALVGGPKLWTPHGLWTGQMEGGSLKMILKSSVAKKKYVLFGQCFGATFAHTLDGIMKGDSVPLEDVTMSATTTPDKTVSIKLDSNEIFSWVHIHINEALKTIVIPWLKKCA